MGVVNSSSRCSELSSTVYYSLPSSGADDALRSYGSALLFHSPHVDPLVEVLLVIDTCSEKCYRGTKITYYINVMRDTKMEGGFLVAVKPLKQFIISSTTSLRGRGPQVQWVWSNWWMILIYGRLKRWNRMGCTGH